MLYFQTTEPRAAAYEIASYMQAVEQLTVTTLRNVVGSMDLERTLTSRDTINSQLRRSSMTPTPASSRPSATGRPASPTATS